MNAYQKSKYENIVFVVLLLVCFVLIFSRSFGALNSIRPFIYYLVYPSVNIANNICTKTDGFAQNIKALIYSHQENILYKQKNKKLSDKLRNFELINQEYETLLKLVKLNIMEDTTSIYARIVVREPSSWYQSFIIDKGLEDGLYNELPVLVFDNIRNSFSVMGIITETYRTSSKVALITNAESVFPVEIKDKSMVCLLEGCGSNLTRITYISQSVSVKAEDELVVSKMSACFPGGVSVGVIKEVIQGSDMDFQTATAEVFFDRVSTNIVVILVPSGQKK